MDYNSISLFFANYSVHSVVIAVVIAIIKIIVEKYFKDKVDKRFLTILPVCITIILDITYSMIFIEKVFALTENMLYSAMLSGGLTTMLSALFRRIISGKKITLDKTTLFLEELLNTYNLDNADNEKIAGKIKTILEDNGKQPTQKEKEISGTLKDEIYLISELEVYSMTKIIMGNAILESQDK